jgi:hypothetical protein
MFTAIICTRAMVNIVYGNRNIKELRVWRFQILNLWNIED